MAGRGRGFILPAWKTQKLAAANPSSQGASAPVGAPRNPQPSQGVPHIGVNTAQQQGGPPGMSVPLVGGAPMGAPMGAPPPVQPNQRGPWTEHEAGGKKYYHNVVTGKTTYEKPDVFKTDIERQLPRPTWKEYIKEGKSYYYNADTNESVWEEPMAFTQYKARLEAMCTGEAPTKDQASMALFNAAKKALEDCIVDSDGTGALKKERDRKAQLDAGAESVKRVKAAASLELKTVSGDLNSGTTENVEYKTPEEAASAFKQMLADKKVPASATWVQALGYGIANDKRFRALKSLKKRKRAFEDYADWQKKKEKETEREKSLKAEDALKDLLQTYSAPSSDTDKPKLNGRLRLGEAISILEHELAFKEVEDSHIREKIIRNHLDDLFDAEKKKRQDREKLQKKEAMLALQELHDSGKISHESDFGSSLKQTLLDTKDPRLVSVDEHNLPSIWKDFVRKLKEQKKKEKADSERRKKELLKSAKDQFYKWLRDQLRTGELSLFKPFSPKEKGQESRLALKDTLLFDIQDKQVYKDLFVLDEKAPAEEYDYIIKKIDDEVEDCRQVIKKMIKKSKIKLNPNSDFKDSKDKFTLYFRENPGDAKSIRKLILNLRLDKRSKSKSKSKDDDSSSVAEDGDFLAELTTSYKVGIVKGAFSECLRDIKKKLKKKKKNFEDLLSDFIYKSEHVGMTWDMVKAKISGEDEFIAMPSMELCMEVFQEYMKSFNAKITAKKEKKRLAASATTKTDSANEEEDGEIVDEEKKDSESLKRKLEVTGAENNESKKGKLMNGSA
mmetsp:Transcript_6018/g.7862  ORF Transcript_6018/g.7862 Transcript_6018/m.7862 type:complete len:786 (+) Transcript_6018:118-2475(+)